MQTLPRARMLMLALTLGCAIIAIAGCGGAPSAPPSGDAAPTASAAAAPPTAALSAVGKIGDRIEANSAAITVTKVQTVAQMPDGQKAGADNIFVITDITLENVSADSVDYSQYTFQLKDADGKTYSSSLTLDSKALRQGSLSKGQQAQGYLAFQVSKTAKGLVLEYTRSGFGPVDITLS